MSDVDGKMLPKRSPGVTRKPQESPRKARGGPKRLQGGPKEAPRGTREPPRRSQGGPKTAPRGPKRGPNEAKMGGQSSGEPNMKRKRSKSKNFQNIRKTYVFEGFQASGGG